MKPDLLSLLIAAAVVTPFQSSAAPSDRHPGIYRFTPVSPQACAEKQRERRLAPRPEQLRKLGDLPPAYVIRLASVARTQPPGFDPCGAIERVK